MLPTHKACCYHTKRKDLSCILPTHKNEEPVMRAATTKKMKDLSCLLPTLKNKGPVMHAAVN